MECGKGVSLDSNSDVHYPESGRFNFILDGCGPWGWGWVQKIEILCVRH